jgi:hypothetical protein
MLLLLVILLSILIIYFPSHGNVYSIQHYVIKFISDLRQVGDFLRVVVVFCRWLFALLSHFVWLLCCLAFTWRLLIAPLASSNLVLFLLIIVLSGLQITASDYPFGVFTLFLSFFFWLLCCLTFKLRLLITPFDILKLSCPFSFCYCVVWPSNYGFWLPQ